ncbi:AsnC family transcriptional regulator, partial [bacterium SCGC AG-212-C10]
MTTAMIPISIEDPVNAAILAVSEDRISGFWRNPLAEIAVQSGQPLPVVIERIRAMLDAGVIRRVRQTLLATNLAHGALVAWSVPAARLQAAFDTMFQDDPFSGHVVLRSTDGATAGSQYRLWTTLKVPQGYSLEKHAQHLQANVGAEAYRIMPAKFLFALGVGHTRRRGLEPGSRTDGLADVQTPAVVALSDMQWRVLTALKREFEPAELTEDPWRARSDEADVSLDTFLEVATELNRLDVIGRFSTFLEHVKELPTGERVTRYNGLFHWTVPAGREIDAGREVGRHHVITHAYWREGGPEFGNVNLMAVAHGSEKPLLLEHKRAIDE